MMLIQILLLFLVPLVLSALVKHWAILEKIGVVTACYILGILFTNIPIVYVHEETSKQVIELVVPLFLPLLLFNSQFQVWRKLGKSILISFFFCVLSVSISAAWVSYVFREVLQDSWKIGSMMIGVYTGGTPNLSAIGLAVEVSPELFVVLNATDLLFGGIWLAILLSVAKPIVGRVLSPNTLVENKLNHFDLDERLYPSSLIALLLSGVILGISVGFSFLIHQKIHEVLVILSISTLGIVASLYALIRNLKGSYGMGNYLLLVFCLAVGSIAKFDKVWDMGFYIVAFVGLLMLSTLLLHFFFSWVFRIDVDTFLISSTAGLFGPAFIAPVANAIRNPLIISLGIAVSILGFGVANYVGISMSYFLRWLTT